MREKEYSIYDIWAEDALCVSAPRAPSSNQLWFVADRSSGPLTGLRPPARPISRWRPRYYLTSAC